MTCYHPLECVLPFKTDIEGKRHLLFSKSQIYDMPGDIIKYYSYFDKTPYGIKIKVPCGHCLGCMIDRSRMWALRCTDEAKMHEKNVFLTLTFNENYIHDNRSVSKTFLSQFMKRFRYYYGDGIRFLGVGEYGEKKLRPHYHLLLFNFDFDDKYEFKVDTHRGVSYWRSPFLEKYVWCDVASKDSLGFSIIGDVNFQTSAYVSRYCTKKIFNNKKHRLAYFKDKEPEFMNFSRNYGIGFEAFLEYHTEYLSRGYCDLVNGKKFIKMPVPRYYINMAEKYFPKEFSEYKLKCYDFLIKNLFNENIDNTTERLLTREELKKMKVDKLVRSYELDTDLHNI